MSYIDYIKKSKISNEEWDVLLSQSSEKFLQGVLKSQISDNRFFGNELLLKLLYFYIFNWKTSFIIRDYIKEEQILYRSRIYTESDGDDRWENNTDEMFKGYNEKNSGAPETPGENRCSPKFIKCLYASNNVETSICEVSPSQGDYVSVADIKILQTLNIVNFNITITAAYEAYDRRAKWVNDFIFSISNLFSASIREDKKEEYLLCQYISEYIRLLGFDGIRYKSAKSNCCGENYSIFSLDKCKPISSKLYKVTNVEYDFYPYEE